MNCSHCGFELPENHSGCRHYGTSIAHQEYECLSLLRAKIESLEAEIAAIGDGSGISNIIAQHESQLAAERELTTQQAQEIADLREAVRDAESCERFGWSAWKARPVVRRALEAIDVQPDAESHVAATRFCAVRKWRDGKRAVAEFFHTRQGALVFIQSQPPPVGDEFVWYVGEFDASRGA